MAAVNLREYQQNTIGNTMLLKKAYLTTTGWNCSRPLLWGTNRPKQKTINLPIKNSWNLIKPLMFDVCDGVSRNTPLRQSKPAKNEREASKALITNESS